MRLPIYRRLDEGLRIFGLSLRELALLGLIFVGVGELLSFWRWGRLAALLFTIGALITIRIINRRMESFFLEKFFRFAGLPKSLGRAVFLKFDGEGVKNESSD